MPFRLEIVTNDLAAPDHAPDLRFCTDCGRPLDPETSGLEFFRRPKGGLRLSRSADGLLIGSPAFWRHLPMHVFGLSSRRLVNGYDLVWPKRLLWLADPPAGCAGCGLFEPPERVTIGYGEPPVAPLEIVGIAGAPFHLIAGSRIAGIFRDTPGWKIPVGRDVRAEPWPRGDGAVNLAKQDVIAFPRPKRPPRRRGSIRAPLLPE